MKRLAAIVAMILALAAGKLCALAMGQTVVSNYTQAMCRIYVTDGSAGSGTLIGKSERAGMVLTCAHLFREARGVRAIVFPNGETHQGRVIGVDDAGDLAAVEIGPTSADPMAVSNYQVSKGELLASAGYGGTQENRGLVNQGTVEKFTQSRDGQWSGFRIKGSARAGDSGGPVFNEAGEISGVLWGGNEAGVYATNCQRVTAFLKQCPPSGCQPSWGQYQPQYVPPVPYSPGPAPPPITQPAQPPALPPVKPRPPELVKGPQGDKGEPGPQGPSGPQGPVGPPGKDAEPVDVSAIVKEVIKNLPPQQAPQIDQAAIVAAVLAQVNQCKCQSPAEGPKQPEPQSGIYYELRPHKPQR